MSGIAKKNRLNGLNSHYFLAIADKQTEGELVALEGGELVALEGAGEKGWAHRKSEGVGEEGEKDQETVTVWCWLTLE
ncbi:hypothetical protein CUROG_00965 [Corynebacterium urogenitale]|uniref:Uncharacterized protein n=1 Tax=Corynebacterium urogenitale TaxID=2487892 RepID=A0A5J6Z3N4_9CORY|nr:hypothetical protein [Corynebacterium urogenitale]QFQ01594.1 hypothetical protein CUROG_00965 [Corynebacterium urogenitale]